MCVLEQAGHGPQRRTEYLSADRERGHYGHFLSSWSLLGDYCEVFLIKSVHLIGLSGDLD